MGWGEGLIKACLWMLTTSSIPQQMLPQLLLFYKEHVLVAHRQYCWYPRVQMGFPSPALYPVTRWVAKKIQIVLTHTNFVSERKRCVFWVPSEWRQCSSRSGPQLTITPARTSRINSTTSHVWRFSSSKELSVRGYFFKNKKVVPGSGIWIIFPLLLTRSQSCALRNTFWEDARREEGVCQKSWKSILWFPWSGWASIVLLKNFEQVGIKSQREFSLSLSLSHFELALRLWTTHFYNAFIRVWTTGSTNNGSWYPITHTWHVLVLRRAEFCNRHELKFSRHTRLLGAQLWRNDTKQCIGQPPLQSPRYECRRKRMEKATEFLGFPRSCICCRLPPTCHIWRQ